MEVRVERVGAREGYDLWAPTYDSTANPVVAMDGRHTLALLAAQGGERVLDAGCGTGRNLGPLRRAGVTVCGIDFSAGMLAQAHAAAPGAPLAQADLHALLPFRDGCFDAVLCALIGEHLDRLEFTFAEFLRVLRPGGRLVFSVYHPQLAEAGKEANFERAGVEYRLGAVRYSTADYERMAAGFSGVEVFEFVGDAELARAIPKAAELVDRPVIFALRGYKEGPQLDPCA